MYLAKSNEMKYVGFINGFHILESLDKKEVVQLREGKYFDAPTSVALILKEGGGIEPTYMLVRKFGSKVTGEVCSKLLKTAQHFVESVK